MRTFFAKYKPYYKSNLSLALPVVISQLGHTLVHAASSVIVGHFAGTAQLAAVSLVNSVFMIVLVVGLGVSYGLTPNIAQENGRGNQDECGRLLANSLLINVATSILLFVLVYFGSMLAIDHLDQSPEVVAYAKPYLLLLAFSIIPLMLFSSFKQFTEGLGFTKRAMMISIWGNVLNIVLGIILVKGLLGIRPMGVEGVGWSTLVDRCVMAVAMGWNVFRSIRFKPYLKHFALSSIDQVRALRIFRIGAPVALQSVFEVGAFSGAAILVGTIGAVEQAAHQVAMNLASMTFMMASGIGSAAAIKTGHNLGSYNLKELRLSALSSYHIMLLFMSVTALAFVCLNHLLPWAYTSDSQVIATAGQLLLIAGLFQLFDGGQVVGLGILRGMGDVNAPTVMTFLAYWVAGLPLSYLLGIEAGLGATGVWIGLTFGLLIAAILLFIRFNRQSKLLEARYAVSA